MEIDLEIGKWLLDISKYLITAFLLTTAFGDMSNPWIVLGTIITAATTFGLGYFLLKKGQKKGDSAMTIKKKIYKKR